MCGIFGYVGNKEAVPILIDGLKALEYRGYDSAGIYLPQSGVVKSAGPIAKLEEKLNGELLGTSGIAHTRWATHGEPNERNAHPHLDMSGAIAVVHNGIVENYKEIKEGLITRGITFSSDTDSEVLTKLIGTLYAGDLVEAVRNALRMVRGTYGLAISSSHHPNQIVVARMGSPIVLGIGKDCNFVSSDPAALVVHTKDVIYLDDGDMALIEPDKYRVYEKSGKHTTKQPEKIEWDIEEVKKGGFEHYMLKEIHDAPEVLQNTTRGRLLHDEERLVKLGGLEPVLDKLKDLDRLTIVGCGSAYYAGLIGKYILEEYAGLPVDVELGSEYRYKRAVTQGKTAVLAVTQSGETADTLASVRKAKEQGLLTLGIVNVVGSTIARETDAGVYNHAGPEVAVASTKAFISQITVLALFTLMLAEERGVDKKELLKVAKELQQLPEKVEKYLINSEGTIKQIAKKYSKFDNTMFVGRKFHAPLSAEGALKLKEVSYVHAEAYAGGELKHGPIALLDENFPVIALAPEDDVYGKMSSNIEEVRARKAPVLLITTEGNTHTSGIADDILFIPKVHPMLQPIVTSIPLQLLAYYVGTGKGYNVDRPRNLAKSVTVE
jgi:glutamine---fructose-6-phosphate transaminase (isomerizing)